MGEPAAARVRAQALEARARAGLLGRMAKAVSSVEAVESFLAVLRESVVRKALVRSRAEAETVRALGPSAGARAAEVQA
jgi:archaellum biogenesis protein FlaJ (TadC family)